MMFADLIDEVDFRERLQECGAILPLDASPETCVRLAKEQQLVGLVALATELLAEPGLLQPEVKEALAMLESSTTQIKPHV